MDYKLEVGLLAGLVLSLVLVIYLTKKALKRYSVLRSIDPNRKKVILNIMYFTYYLVAILLVIAILGVDMKQFGLFLSSIFAVLGVGFFAQWSLLSNLTASFILFFYHPVRIGDKIKVLDKDFDMIGCVEDMKGFYLLLKTEDGMSLTIPNSLLLQKGIEFVK